MQIATHSGLGIYVNEMQRTINGLGHYPHAGAGGIYDSRITPYGYWRSYHPSDARGQFGAARMRRRRGLGDVPNDFEASVDLQYIPVRQGWYYGHPVDGSRYPDARGGLGQTTPAAPATADDILAQLAKSERTQTIFQIISTVSIATLATLAIVRAIRTAKNGRPDRPFLGDDEDDDDAAY